MSDEEKRDRVSEEVERRAERARWIREREEDRVQAMESLSQKLTDAIQTATRYPVEIVRGRSEATNILGDGWDLGREAVGVFFYKEMFDKVVRKPIGEIRILAMDGLERIGNALPYFAVVDRTRQPDAIVCRGVALEEALSKTVELVVNALATSIEAGCRILPPDEGAARMRTQEEWYQSDAPPPAKGPQKTSPVLLALLAGLALVVLWWFFTR